jgi:hypothetical protein
VTERESQEQTIPLHRFNVETLLLLVDALDNGQRLAEQDVVKIVGARNREGIGEYRRFLISAGAIQVSSGVWETLARARELAIAVRNEDIIGVRSVLLAEPSFAHFVRQLSEHGVGHAWDPSEFRRSVSTYLTLAEIIRVGAPISGEGFFATPSLPTLEDFARVALARFHELDRSDGLVATGAWLEALIRTDAIHPEIARLRLNDASAMKLLRRSTEGSTTDLRSDNHSIQVLRVQGGRPVVRTVHLYRGDYLIPGKSSTSLRIESPKP